MATSIKTAPVLTASYSFKKETPGFWVYEMGRPGVGQLYVPKALVPKQPADQLKADFFKVK